MDGWMDGDGWSVACCMDVVWMEMIMVLTTMLNDNHNGDGDDG